MEEGSRVMEVLTTQKHSNSNTLKHEKCR